MPKFAWARSLRSRQLAREAITHWNTVTRPTLPRCSAKAKHTGLRCRQLALANGKCRFHGGKTPRGAKWHTVTWPSGNSATAERRFYEKLERSERERKERLSNATPEQLARYEKWRRDHPPGSGAPRRRNKLTRSRAKEARESSARIDASNAARAAEHERAVQREIERLTASPKASTPQSIDALFE